MILARSFAVLEADHPAAFHRFTRALAGLTIHVEVGAERFTLTVRNGAPAIRPEWSDEARPATVLTDRSGILALIDGSKSLFESVSGRELRVTADPDTLVRLSQGLTCFAEGAVRSPRMRALLAELRGCARS